MKLIEYSEWCDKCRWENIPSGEEPCNECLNTPAREDSHKPIKFEEKEK